MYDRTERRTKILKAFYYVSMQIWHNYKSWFLSTLILKLNNVHREQVFFSAKILQNVLA
jgi:hypothetical protein